MFFNMDQIFGFETETETLFPEVSMTRRDRDFFSSESQYRDETETFFFLVSMSRRDRDFFSLSLNVEARQRLFSPESKCREEIETISES